MRILLVEDDSSLADGLVKLIHRDGYTVNHVATGGAALAAVASEPQELVILDLGLPDIDGLDVLRRLQSVREPPLVLILTARDSTADKVAGLDLGADDYLAKPFEPSELLARLRALDRRIGGRHATTMTLGTVSLDDATRAVTVAGTQIDLSRREFMLLKALMEKPGRVLSREQLEHRLYGWGEETASNAIEVHVHHLRKKLPEHFIKTVRGVGYTVKQP